MVTRFKSKSRKYEINFTEEEKRRGKMIAGVY